MWFLWAPPALHKLSQEFNPVLFLKALERKAFTYFCVVSIWPLNPLSLSILLLALGRLTNEVCTPLGSAREHCPPGGWRVGEG